jgi:DNA-binding SARP family transcriptional activator
VQFRVLGPIEVDGVAGRIRIDRGKPLALLGLLLLRANQVLSIEEILDALWGDELPDSAEHAVEVYVSRLRHALGPDRIQTQAPGYRLRVTEGELDLLHFTQLISEAKAASESGNPGRAASLLEDAEGLWRGPPLPELVGTPSGIAEINRLHEMRLGATEARIDARLASGAASELVPELERSVAAHPYREHVTGQLMLALYRAGRQADALAVFTAARQTLDEELGVEPGADLQRLQVRILQQDPALDQPRERRVTVPDHAPREVAARTGRWPRGRVAIAAMSAVTVVVVALGLIGAIRFFPAGTGIPSRAPSSPPAPKLSGPAWSAQEAILLAAVPTVLRDRCHVTEAGEQRAVNATASLHCPPGVGSEADDAWYELFDGVPLLNAAFDQLVPEGVAGGQCSADRTNRVGTWATTGGTFDGDRLCFSRDGKSWMVWTYRDRRILARAMRGGEDSAAVAALYNWWYDIAVELR